MSEKTVNKQASKIQQRMKVFDLLSQKSISQVEASKRLKLTTRQIRRIGKRYAKCGIDGLISKKIGQQSKNKIPDEIRENYIDIVRKQYKDFGPTFAHEKLTEFHNASFSIETLRQWMIKDGLWTPHIKPKKRNHPLRERRSCLGELVQIDGSKHLWFEERGEYSTLLAAIDDATSRILAARFVPVESAENYLHMFKDYFVQHGVPASLYTDKHGIFKVNARGCDDNETQFKRIVDGLGIQLINANTPQAKGRVERLFKTLQDRLVKELRIAGINTIDAANDFLLTYIPKHNHQFSVPPASDIDKHKPLALSEEELDKALSFKHQRQVRNDYSLSFRGNKFEVLTHNPMPYLRGQKVDILESLSGDLVIQFQGKELQKHRADSNSTNLSAASAKTINYVVDEIIESQLLSIPETTLLPDSDMYCTQQQSFDFEQHPVI